MTEHSIDTSVGEQQEKEAVSYGDAELQILSQYLQSVVPQLLEVHPDRLHFYLQQENTKAVLKAFAEETSSRTLVIAKKELGGGQEEEATEEGAEKEEKSEASGTVEKTVDLIFSASVEYHGTSAMTVAFLKRDGYRQLDLRPKEKSESQSADNSVSTMTDFMDLNDSPDLSSQLQVINMGYLGAESNIFELAQTYVSFSFVPLFNDFRNQSNKGQAASKDADESLGKVLTSLNNLKMQLAQCQESSSIPEVKLEIEPEIKRRTTEKRAVGEVVKNTDFEDLLAGAGRQAFLDSLERYVQTWQNQIRKVTQLEHNIGRGSSAGELKFWKEMEDVLGFIQSQLNSDEVVLTLAVLNMAKKPRLVMQFQSTVKQTLAQKEKLAKTFNRAMRDFPLKTLQDAMDIPKVDAALGDVFQNLKSIKRVHGPTYSIERVIDFTKAVCRDFDTQVKKVINQQSVMRIRFDELKQLHQHVIALKAKWKEAIKDATKVLAGQAAMITTSTAKLAEQLVQLEDNAVLDRIDLIYAFRREHHELHEVILGSFTKDKAVKDNVLEEMHAAYEQFCQSADPLDVTAEGGEKWKQARKDYEKSTANIETQFAVLIKERLSRATTAKAMFQVFAFYNKLLNRKKVRSAIQSYQADLLTQVMGDIKKLGERLQGEPKKEHRLSLTRNIPDTANRIIWLDQLKTRLKGYERQVRDVLGDQWERKQEAVDIKKECEMAERKLHRQQSYYVDLLTRTLNNLQPRNEKEKTIFRIEKRGTNKNQLALNINEDLFFLHKEQLNLERIDLSEALGYGQKRIHFNFGSQSKINEVKHLYPVAMSLKHSIRTFQVTLALVHEKCKPLLAKKMNDAMDLFEKGLRLIWRNETSVKTYALKNLAHKVIDFEDAVTIVSSKSEQVDELLEELKVCEPDIEEFNTRLAKVQRIIEEFVYHEYSNLDAWVDGLNARIEEILVTRLGSHLESWVNEFRLAPDELEGDPKLIKHNFVLEFQIVNGQNIVLEPSLQEARAYWYKALHDQVEILCGRERISSGQYGRGGHEDGAERPEDRTYMNLLMKMGCNAEGKATGFTIKQCYMAIEEVFAEAKDYAETWRSFQSLWDINLTEVYGTMLGDDISRWNQLLNEIRQGRKTIVTNEDFRCFGRLQMSYGGVQSKVHGRYDQLHKEILNKFGDTLGEKMITFRSTLSEARKKLENLDPQSTDVTLFVTEIQDMRIAKQKWEKEMGYCNSGQKVLSVQRYKEPDGWVGIGPLEQQYSYFIQILDKRSRQFEEQKASLAGNIEREEKRIDAEIAEIKTEWANSRPDKATRDPKQASPQIESALNRLVAIGARIDTAQSNLVRNSKAKELLALGFQDPKQLDGIQEEYRDLTEVWEAMNGVWSAVAKLNDTPFQVYQHRVVKDVLEEKKEEMQKMKNKIRSYPVYEVYMGFVQDYRKVNDIMQDLHADSMKKRHWAELLVRLQMGFHQGNYTEMWLQHLWDCNLLQKQHHISEVLTQARGEALIENFLYGSKETWKTRELELTRFKTKCKLIRGWEDLRNGIDEHISNIASMKMSPYYKVFQEQIEPWDEKLQKMMIVFDTWQDLQTRYVYLEGIFFGSADIKTMLINEFNRFKDIDHKFNHLMKQVSQNPFVLAVLDIPLIEENLEKWVKHLNAIKKALGDYLEKQRQSFARFYFVGDDDLLEIIGNSKNISSVQRHFPKMFAGITTVQSSEDGDKILGMISREGEEVAFSSSVDIASESAIHKWLTKVESTMQVSLATLLDKALMQLLAIDRNEEHDEFNEWIVKYPAQIVGLAMQVDWSQRVDESLMKKSGSTLPREEDKTNSTLEILAEKVLSDMPKEIRQKYEQLITECVHQRNVIRDLVNARCTANTEFTWLYYMRYYYNQTEEKTVEKLGIQMANGQFFYGFEYLGVGEKLVQTPLTDRCYLTLTQALHWRMGGSPFGPAGTGKTESVKALGATLGYFVLVFNCDETFDGNAMGRIFVGLCQVGAWGCFDEFNRLEERMLSAVSQQILTIQTGLRDHAKRIQMMERDFALNPAMGIFITMNPDYAGRSNLPDNLKQLFRQMAMVKPDKNMIAQVMLFSQGFKTAERLSGKMVQLFDLCLNQLSSQSHYDFGLRALKSVLVTSGNLKRSEKKKVKDASEIDAHWEQNILLKSLCDTLVPKLIADDIPLLQSLLSGVFPGADIISIRDEDLVNAIHAMCKKYNLLPSAPFVEKVIQLNQIQNLCHGVMMVGPTGCGKTAAWKVLLDCLERLDGVKGVPYVIDPKAISKDDLYGKLDATTAEWTDGVFTKVLRRVIDNAKGESSKRHWIVFDGDVDPEWAENLNSVLDDNKLLTLPSGERLMIPPNVRMMFEVETLKYATLATVSRCGMVWFSETTVIPEMIFHHYLCRLGQDVYDSIGEAPAAAEGEGQAEASAFSAVTPETLANRKIRKHCVESIRSNFEGEACYMMRVLREAEKQPHIMDYTIIRVLEALFALMRKGIENVIQWRDDHQDFPLDDGGMSAFCQKWLIFATIWGVGGSMNLAVRTKFGNSLAELSDAEMPSLSQADLIDYDVRMEDQKWYLFKERVPDLDIDPKQVMDADFVITTVDTERHQQVLCSWLSEHRPFLLCGPPGSGKTMTLMATLKMVQDMEMIFINFSSGTTPSLILKTFDHYCVEKKTRKGIVLSPHQAGKWLCIFCDEINLPTADAYNTQKVITFLRQMTEQGGFYRSADKEWVHLERIQFVGACNPPQDAGRHPMSNRFLRHAPLIFVDFPGPASLRQIYGTFNKGMLKRVPQLRQYAEPLTEAMVGFYTESQNHFTVDMQAHYIYSPRELTRWKTALYEALAPVEEPEDLVRLYVHEALRLFEDRLVYPEEKEWCNQAIDAMAQKCFPGVNHDKALARPIYYTTYLTQHYQSVSQEELRSYIVQRLKDFYEEELNVRLVVFDSVLDHVLRIDRVLKQPLGHLLLVGCSGVGKTTLTKFVSWLNNLSSYQIKAGRNYSVADFDEDLRAVMRRSGCRQEKICFIFDESNILSSAFLERMNALLAGGEVPGLFDGDDYTALINECKAAGMNADGLDDADAIYRAFTKNVQRYLHVVFTMNPANPDFSNRSASSPALFNRCVIDWFGDWTEDGMRQVATDLTRLIDIPNNSFSVDMHNMPGMEESSDDPKNIALSNCLVDIHCTVRDLNGSLQKAAKKFNYVTPRDFIDLVKHFENLHAQKKRELNELQDHLNAGLSKLASTEEAVLDLQQQLQKFDKELAVKTKQKDIRFAEVMQEDSKVKALQAKAAITKVELEEKRGHIAERTEVANRELGEAEPALHAAQNSVQGLKKSDIDELKSFRKPSAKIQYALEPVIALLLNLHAKPDWALCFAQLKTADFTLRIMDFDKDAIKGTTKTFIQTAYLSNKAYDPDAFMFASRAVGPLTMWLKAIVRYADIIASIAPLRKEITDLEQSGAQLELDMSALVDEIDSLKKRQQQLTSEYENLVSESDSLKKQKEEVGRKETRARSLFSNLSAERGRWQESSEGFREQLASLVGDVLLSAGFLTYIGFFDHGYRVALREQWTLSMDEISLKSSSTLSFVEYLSKPQQRIKWQDETLPNDELCIQNAIIMERFNRYPLVIDPSNQALEYMCRHYDSPKRKLQKTSFADESFLNHLVNAIRFGLPLVVQDVEMIDPFLNSVLNKEVQKKGGRPLLRVGDKEVEYFDTFSMYMITRNQNARFTPDLCSRVTFINFTVTPSSLQNQCLNIYLANERPDIDAKRKDLLKLQGEKQARLKELEDMLLTELSNSEDGNILENDKLIATLETLKKESAQIKEEMEQAEVTLLEIDSVLGVYQPLSQMSSRIFFTLQALGGIHYLYQYSLQQFMDVLNAVLSQSEGLQALPKAQHDKRLDLITKEIFIKFNHSFSQGLLEDHQLMFAIRLAQIRIQDDEECVKLFDMFLNPRALMDPKAMSANILGGRLSRSQVAQLEELDESGEFAGLADNLERESGAWEEFLNSDNPQDSVPEPWMQEGDSSATNGGARLLKQMVIVKVFRPDKFAASAAAFIKHALTDESLNIQQADLQELVAIGRCDPKSPLCLVSAPGFDASYRVEELAKSTGKKLKACAIGSPEAFELAYRMINEAGKAGTWVLLKNVHLAPAWLFELEKHVYKMQANQAFRLFLTMENNPKVPSTLLRAAQVLVFEPPAGIKAALARSYKQSITPQRTDAPPVQRSRLHFIVAWFNAVVTERLRYTPIGWSKVYAFNEADQRCTLVCVDQWLDSITQGRTHVDPDKIPWDALRCLIAQSVFGGKVDNEYDQKILQSLVDQFFCPESFNLEFELFQPPVGTESLMIPEGKSHQQFQDWIHSIQKVETPAWSGLPNNVEKIVRERNTREIIACSKQIQGHGDDESLSLSKKTDAKETGQAKWLVLLGNTCEVMLGLLPESLPLMTRTEEAIKNPLFRFLEREVTVASGLLKHVTSDLEHLREMCEGTRKTTNELKAIAEAIHAEVIPRTWNIYKVADITATAWINDFVRRVKQLQRLQNSDDFGKAGLWFGGLLFPEAYLTATRQFVAQENKWSLEELELKFELNLSNDEIAKNSQGFILTDTCMEGAEYHEESARIRLTEKLSSQLPVANFKWIHVSQREAEMPSGELIQIPVYLNKQRKILLTSVSIPTHGVALHIWYQRGVAVFAWDQ